MRKIDYLGLDGNALRTFLTVLEEMSVSRAADALGVSQSAVSHTLDKLRRIFGDALFVRDGRGIESTPRARALRPSVENILNELKALTDGREFDPQVEHMEFTIACNDFPLQLIFPTLLDQVSAEGIDLRIRFVPAGIPNVSMLRASRFRMLITPTPPDDPDLERAILIQSKMEIFYDSNVRQPPKTRKQYAASNRVEVRFSDTESSIMASPSINVFEMNRPVISVPNFGSLTAMIKGSDRVTTQIGAMKLGLLKELDSAPLPFKTETISLCLMWHRRENTDPAHQWLRQRIIETVESVTIS
jgi:DNA-binding transcriptional LysR family regulator